MVLDTQTGKVRNIHDEHLSLPITRKVANEKTLVTRTGNDFWTFKGSAHLDSEKRPHIAINVGRDLGRKTGGPKQTTHYRWDGSNWVGGFTVNPQSKLDNTVTRGDFYFEPVTSHIKYLLGYQDGSDGVVAVFESADNGESFEKTKELLRKPGASWALTAKISNAHPDAQLIVAEKQAGATWHKVYLLGANGPVERLSSEANLRK